MLKSVVLAVKVGEEVFGAFRQVENGLKVDNFCTCCGDIREIARQKLRKAREMDPRNTEIRVRCGYLDFMLMPTDERGKRHSGEVGQIRQELEEACKELATADYLRVYLGDLEKLEGNLEAAQKWYEEALKLNAGNLPAQRALRLMKDREKKTKEAQAPAGSWLDRIKSLLTKKL